jgi:hypothetical protein
MNEDHRCSRCGHPLPATVVDTGAAGALIAELRQEIDHLRATVARLRGPGADPVPVRLRH